MTMNILATSRQTPIRKSLTTMMNPDLIRENQQFNGKQILLIIRLLAAPSEHQRIVCSYINQPDKQCQTHLVHTKDRQKQTTIFL
jgi:hypothetical protein